MIAEVRHIAAIDKAEYKESERIDVIQCLLFYFSGWLSICDFEEYVEKIDSKMLFTKKELEWESADLASFTKKHADRIRDIVDEKQSNNSG